MFFCRLILSLLAIVTVGYSQVTYVSKTNPLLSRTKRYLAFPTGSNLVFTFSASKAFMQSVPKGFIALGECDVPFMLPNDTRLFKKEPRVKYRQRRRMQSQLEKALSGIGWNGVSCMKRLICETQRYVLTTKENSLVKDILIATFGMGNIQSKISCASDEQADFSGCPVSLFRYIIGSLKS